MIDNFQETINEVQTFVDNNSKTSQIWWDEKYREGENKDEKPYWYEATFGLTKWKENNWILMNGTMVVLLLNRELLKVYKLEDERNKADKKAHTEGATTEDATAFLEADEAYRAQKERYDNMFLIARRHFDLQLMPVDKTLTYNGTEYKVRANYVAGRIKGDNDLFRYRQAWYIAIPDPDPKKIQYVWSYVSLDRTLMDGNTFLEKYNQKTYNTFRQIPLISESDSKDIKDILSLLNTGNPITDPEQWKKLNALFDTANPLRLLYYHKLIAPLYEERFRWNFDFVTIDSPLFDIRNSDNFRTSDNKKAEVMGKSYLNSTLNPFLVDNTNKSKSYYMSRNDFCWSLNYRDVRTYEKHIEKHSIQNIILNEYQPTLQYNMGTDLFNALDEAAGTAGKVLFAKTGLGDIGAKLGGFLAGKAAEALYNSSLKNFSEKPNTLYNAEQYKEKMNPMYYILRLFTRGRWLNTFLLPFVSNGQVKTDYLKMPTDPGSWHIGGLTDKTSQGGATQVLLHDRISLSIPASPTFTVSNAHQSTMNPLEIDFYLINKDDIYLDKNFQFMQALFAGTQWVTMLMGVVAATNVYQVLVPGRFRILWASLNSSFKAIGKLRTNEHMYAMYNDTIKMILSDTLWPEAWHVSLTIKPLVPWNFNTHMAYYLNGHGTQEKLRIYSNIIRGNVMDQSSMSVEEIMRRRDVLQQEINKVSEYFANYSFHPEGADNWWRGLFDSTPKLVDKEGKKIDAPFSLERMKLHFYRISPAEWARLVEKHNKIPETIDKLIKLQNEMRQFYIDSGIDPRLVDNIDSFLQIDFKKVQEDADREFREMLKYRARLQVWDKQKMLVAAHTSSNPTDNNRWQIYDTPNLYFDENGFLWRFKPNGDPNKSTSFHTGTRTTSDGRQRYFEWADDLDVIDKIAPVNERTNSRNYNTGKMRNVHGYLPYVYRQNAYVGETSSLGPKIDPRSDNFIWSSSPTDF